MNILGVGFYDDFARFFNELRKQAKIRGAKFHYITIFFSGYCYLLSKVSVSTWITPVVWFIFLFNRSGYYIKAAESEYKGINLEKIIRYHYTSDNAHEKYYRAIACAYIDYAYQYLQKNNINMLLVSGDSRMQCVAFIEVAKLQGVKVYYFEQGAFDTTFIDSLGVNANSIARKIKIAEPNNVVINYKDVLSKTLHKKKNSKFKRVKVFRALDKVLNVFLLVLFPFSEITEKFPRTQNIADTKKAGNHNICEPFVLFAAQVPHDVNMISHSPVFNSHYQIIKFINENVPDNYKIVVREHPLYKGRYESEFYDYISHHDRIILDNSTQLHETIERADLVIVNNSTVGIESLALGTRVFVTGESYYDCFPGVWSITNSADSKKLKFGEYSLSEAEYQNSLHYLSILFNDVLYAGHFRDDDLQFTAQIMNDIINDEVRCEKNNLGD